MIELYKDLIIDHGLNPRNKYIMKNFTHHSKGFNHFCGDAFDIYLNISNNIITNISFNGTGCAISIASSSLMTIYLKDKHTKNIYEAFNYFQNLIKNNIIKQDKFDNFNLLANVRKFPSRIKCATLPWHITINSLK